MQVGIRVYQIRIYKNHKSYTHSNNQGARDVQAVFRKFTSKFSSKALIKIASADDGSGGEKRSHRFIPLKDVMNTQHGVIRYGTFGYGTEVEDVQTGSVSHTRTIDEADTIPLYYRFWWPDSYSYGLIAFQSYSGRSCGTSILSEFRNFYRDSFDEWALDSKKVVHDELKEHKAEQVKKITLVRPKASGGTISKALRPTNPKTEVDVSLEVTARGAGTFGRLSNLKDKLVGNMSIDGTNYSRAYATVSVNGKPKKIGVVGVSSNTGVIDVTDELDFDAVTMMPTATSIAKATKNEIKDFAVKLGK